MEWKNRDLGSLLYYCAMDFNNENEPGDTGYFQS